MINRIINNPSIRVILSLSVLAIVFAPVFYTDYAFLDEAHQLWNNKDGSNFSMFLVQGRWLTGVLTNKLYSEITAITGLKIIRILSFFSWAIFLEEFFRLGKKWQQLIGFDETLLTIGGIYIACSISLAVYIGWGSCFEVGIATLLGLWSGHLFFIQIMKDKEGIPVSTMVVFLSVITGIGSLLLYQTAFGAFLIPFSLYLIEKKTGASLWKTLSGIGAYLVISVLYYLVFIFILRHYSVSGSDRTDISLDVLGKLGFFFSAPLSQAFSFNFLYNMHSILSQAFPIVIIAGWLIAYIRMDKNKLAKKAVFISGFIGLCLFIYLPLMIARENFSSYRTMFVLNLVVTFLLIDTLLSLFRPNKNKSIFVIGILCCFLAVAFRNFRYNFINPLKEEYRLVNGYVHDNYNKDIHTIYFLRPDDDLFTKAYGVNPFKDEFGVPSTFKDWTPEPIIKQLIMEKTKDRSIAEKVRVIQFTDRAAFETEEKNKKQDAVYINVESLFHLHTQ